jgi:carbon-monoxide dehydrogenase medium subunit
VKTFTFLAPESVAEAAQALHDQPGQARLIAGGQSLLLAMKERLATPSLLVSLSRVPELRGWRYAASGELVVGATTTYAVLADARLSRWHAVLPAVAGDLADRPVRTMGTVGGALCQADPRFDMPPLAVGVDAQVQTVTAAGRRTLAASELFKPEGGTTLGADEILASISFPSVERFTGVGFEKFRYRVFDAAILSATCALRIDPGGRVAEARIAIGAAGPAPVLVAAANELTGEVLTQQHLGDVAAAVSDEVFPAGSCTTALRRYQRELVGVLARRALAKAMHQPSDDQAGSEP